MFNLLSYQKIYAFLPKLVLIGFMLLSGCTLAPTYNRPDAPIPNSFAGEDVRGSDELISWVEFIKDPTMKELVTIAITNNRDLRIAMLNIEKAQAQYRIQQADLLPTISAVGQESMNHVTSEYSPTRAPMFNRQYSASLGFSAFELDLFGKLRSLRTQGVELYYSAQEEANAARLSLVAQVASLYLQLVADRELFDYTEYTVKSYEENLVMVEKMFSQGVASQLDLNQAKSSLAAAKSSLAEYKANIAQDENALRLLLGADLPANLPVVRKLSSVVALPELPAGLPSSLLERRPDIQAAEHQLKAANANIGAARANFFPSISLTGSVGTTSAEFSELFSGSAGIWSFIPQIVLPIFDTGRNIVNLKMSETEKEIAIANYEKTIQNAFKEVSDALAQRASMNEQFEQDKLQAELSESSLLLATNRYEIGVDSYIVLLNAQRSNYMAQQKYVGTRLQKEVNAINVYKVLGGGWN